MKISIRNHLKTEKLFTLIDRVPRRIKMKILLSLFCLLVSAFYLSGITC